LVFKLSKGDLMEKNVSNEKAFWFCNRNGWVGKIAHNLDEFSREINSVPIDSLEFHVRDDKNDFEVWLRDVLQEKRLSKKIAKIKKQGLKGEELRKALISLFE
jgi:hypothetical protein